MVHSLDGPSEMFLEYVRVNTKHTENTRVNL
jgi:hypothetical protein